MLLANVALADPVAITNAGFEDPYLGGNLPPEYNGIVPVGSFPTGAPPAGWTLYLEGGIPIGGSFVGVLNPGDATDHAPNPPFFVNGAPEGNNVALVFMSGAVGDNEFGIEQQLAATVAPDTTYTLTVEVGDIDSATGLTPPYDSFFDLEGFPGYRVQLLAVDGVGGETLLVEDDDSLTIPESFFATRTLVHTTGATPPQEGDALMIRLVSKNEPDVPGVDGLEVDFDDVRLDASPATSVPLPAAAAWVVFAGLALSGWGALSARR
jgi:hypothetical protein